MIPLSGRIEVAVRAACSGVPCSGCGARSDAIINKPNRIVSSLAGFLPRRIFQQLPTLRQ